MNFSQELIVANPSDEQSGLWMDTPGEELMRKAFEEHWAFRSPLNPKPERSDRWNPGGYLHWVVNSEWQTFKAGVCHGIEHQKRMSA